MRIAALLCFLLFTANQSFAQEDDKLFYLQKIEKYRRMKSTGTTLTVLGGGMFIAGVAILSNSSTTTTYNGYSSNTYTEGNPEAGAALFLIGGAGLGAGIPLWIVGSHSKEKYERKLRNLSTAKVYLKPQANGLTLSLRF